MVEPIELCLVDMEMYADNYESYEERCANNDASYNIEYESHEEMCANDVEYESEWKPEQEGGFKLYY